jgi:hypothetical protein
MFNAVGFKIRFERKMTLVHIKSLDENVRRDITFCFITAPNKEENKMDILSMGMAILNPIDQYDKIVGKKLALTDALQNGNFSFGKYIRTNIWKYFWLWVSNWPSQIAVNLLKHEKTKTQN